jgi:hypothetical protein
VPESLPPPPRSHSENTCGSRYGLRGWPFSHEPRRDITLTADTKQPHAERYADQDRRLREHLGFDVDQYIDDYVSAHDAYRQTEESQTARLGLKAMALAPTLQVYGALLAGERVPWTVLDYLQAMRYGLRVAPSDGRVSLLDFNDVPAA